MGRVVSHILFLSFLFSYALKTERLITRIETITIDTGKGLLLIKPSVTSLPSLCQQQGVLAWPVLNMPETQLPSLLMAHQLKQTVVFDVVHYFWTPHYYS